MRQRIGFVSTRLAGTDGVSLEAAKWAKVLTGLGCECYYFAGESEWPAERTYTVPEAHFAHPAIEALTAEMMSTNLRSPTASAQIENLKDHLKVHLSTFVRQFDVQMLIAENALSLPMNIPLGLALTELIAETGIPTIAHHHDFAWERERFAINAAEDYLRTAFPPVLSSIHHVTINSFASRQLALRTGASSTIVPNVLDFATPPPPLDEYAADLRAALGIGAQEHLLLQPTRIVPRKRIERSIELARRVGPTCTVVITHIADEGQLYVEYLRDYAKMLDVRVIFASDIIAHARGATADGRKVYSLADTYQQADLITYPSSIEGFGNAFLETIYYKRPIVMSRYEIYRTDIEPKGFSTITFDGFITNATVARVWTALTDPDWVAEAVAHNYELGRRYYSYQTLERFLTELLHRCARPE